MSLRLRLILILGGAFVLIWALAAAWMFRDLRGQMMFSLDQRLVASARMVAGLVQQLPHPLAPRRRVRVLPRTRPACRMAWPAR